MGLIVRLLLLVLFGIGLVVLEVRAFSTDWTWSPAQLLLVAAAVAILAAWVMRRRNRP